MVHHTFPSESHRQAIEQIKKEMANLIKFARDATDDYAIENLTAELRGLEKRKREAEALLYNFEEDEEERQALEDEIVKFER